MVQVDVLEAKNNFSKLIRMLESGEEDIIIICRNGEPVIQMTLLSKSPKKSIIGIAKDDEECEWSEDIHLLDDEIADMFMDNP